MSANKNINILLKLQDKFTKPLSGTTAEIKKQKLQIKAAGKVINNWAYSANSKFKTVAGAAGKLGIVLGTLGGVISVAGIKTWCSEAMEGFNAAHEAETKLEAILGNAPSIIAQGSGAAAAAKNRLVALTDQMEETGVIAGDISIAGLQQLATFQLTEDSLTTLSAGMADLIAQQKGLNATQSDAVTVGNMVGKAMTGQTGALSKAGIIMTDYQEKVMKTGNEEQRAAMMAQILKDNVGGVNSALADTDAGKILVMQNVLGRAQDAIGEKLMHMKAQLAGIASKYIPDIQNGALNILDRLQPKIDAFSAYIEAHKAEIQAGLEQTKAVLTTVFKVVSAVVKFCIKHFNILLPILAGIVAYFTAFNIIMTVASMMRTLTTVIQGVSAAGGILNAIMAANPAILIALAIAALIAAGVLLWRNWDKISAVAGALWDKIKTVFGGIRDAICGAFDAAKESVAEFFDWIGDKLGALDKAISSVPVIGQLYTGFKNVASAAIGKIRGNATGTSYFSGGLTRVNEDGRGEIMNLPNGTQIVPHDVSTKAAGRSIVLNLRLIIQGNVIGNREFMEQTGKYVAEKVIEALPTV